MTPPKDQAPGLVGTLRAMSLGPRSYASKAADLIEHQAGQIAIRDGECQAKTQIIEQLEAENAELRGKLELERALTDGAHRRARQVEAENAGLQARIDAGMKACDQFDGPVSRSQFVNGQATCAQQIRAALTEQANIRSPVQSQIREPYEGEDGA